MAQQRLSGKSMEVLAEELLNDSGVPFPDFIALPEDNEARMLIMRHFDSIIKVRTKKEWVQKPFEVNLAAQLAVAMHAAQLAMDDVIKNGHTSMSVKGTPVANPSVGVWSNISGRIYALLGKMHLTLDTSQARSVNNAGREVAGTIADLEDGGDLLAKPN